MNTRRGKYGRRDRAPPAPSKKRARSASSRHSSEPALAKKPGAARSGNTAEGIVSANRAGYGFVRTEGLKESVFLPPGEMRGLMHGDRVRISVRRDGSDRFIGSVEKLLGRGVSAFLGTVEIQGRGAWVSAADRRLQLRCAVAPADLTGARNGDWVIARHHPARKWRRRRASAHRKASRPGSARGARDRIGDRPLRVAARVSRDRTARSGRVWRARRGKPGAGTHRSA